MLGGQRKPPQPFQRQAFTGTWQGEVSASSPRNPALCREEPDVFPRDLNSDMSHSFRKSVTISCIAIWCSNWVTSPTDLLE